MTRLCQEWEGEGTGSPGGPGGTRHEGRARGDTSPAPASSQSPSPAQGAGRSARGPPNPPSHPDTRTTPTWAPAPPSSRANAQAPADRVGTFLARRVRTGHAPRASAVTLAGSRACAVRFHRCEREAGPRVAWRWGRGAGGGGVGAEPGAPGRRREGPSGLGRESRVPGAPGALEGRFREGSGEAGSSVTWKAVWGGVPRGDGGAWPGAPGGDGTPCGVIT